MGFYRRGGRRWEGLVLMLDKEEGGRLGFDVRVICWWCVRNLDAVGAIKAMHRCGLP